MTTNSIKIEHLSFGYSKGETTLEDFNMTVPQGAIYGFLGSNGAGKTTSLKLILSLLKGYTGSILFEGKQIKQNHPEYLMNIGSLIEHPSLYGHLTARQNLIIWSKYYSKGRDKIDEVLDWVGLKAVRSKTINQFSTGMKQRLGIASTLLHDPQLLILDEPTNGLDPQGVLALRKMLTTLQQKGKTIIISSHILSEVEKMVSHVGILADKSMKFEGSIEDLLHQKSQNLTLEIQVNDVKKAKDVLLDLTVDLLDESRMKIKIAEEKDIPDIIESLVQNDIKIYEVKKESSDLESMFISYSKGIKS